MTRRYRRLNIGTDDEMKAHTKNGGSDENTEMRMTAIGKYHEKNELA